MQSLKRGIVILLLFAAVLALSTPEVFAETENVIDVTTNADEYDLVGVGTGCSLREAITAANENTPFGGCPTGHRKDKIMLAATTYLLTRAGIETLNVSGDLNI